MARLTSPYPPNTLGKLALLMEARTRYTEPEALKPLSVVVRDVEGGLPDINEKAGANGLSNGNTAHPLASPNGPLPSATSSARRRHTLRAGVAQLSHETGALVTSAEDTMVRFWDRFRRKGKKNIGVWESLNAIVFSSCESYSFYAMITFVHIARAQCASCLYTHRLGFSFPPLAKQDYLCTYVPTMLL